MERLRDIDESALLARLFPIFTGAAPAMADDVPVGPGDDAAVVAAPSGSVVVTTDSMVSGRDWRDDWSGAEDVGHKVVGQNLADVAAMGARPTALVVALAADPDTPVEWCLDLASGMAAAAAAHGVAVVGGDLSSAPPGVVVVAVTALGDLDGRPAVRRSGARPGDVVAVCGTLGRSGAGLALLLRGTTPDDDRASSVFRAHLRAPVPHLAAGPPAAGVATAMVDVSDGLVRDLGRVAAASGVHVDLDRAALAPFVHPLADLLGEDEAWRQVLGGGEEHALVATFPPETDLDALAQGDPARRWVRIGTVASSAHPGRGTHGLGDDAPHVTLDGADPGATGWDHFAG